MIDIWTYFSLDEAFFVAVDVGFNFVAEDAALRVVVLVGAVVFLEVVLLLGLVIAAAFEVKTRCLLEKKKGKISLYIIIYGGRAYADRHELYS